MRKDDARKLDHKTLEELRIRAVRRVQGGESPEVVGKAIGINRTTIYDWISKYRAGGWDALRSRPTPGAKPKIDGKQMEWIFNTVTQKNPQQMKFEFALWTREMIQHLIKQKFEIKLSLKAVGRLLSQLGLTCQKPLYKAIQKDESLVKAWLKKIYPGIKSRASVHRRTAPSGFSEVLIITGSIWIFSDKQILDQIFKIFSWIHVVQFAGLNNAEQNSRCFSSLL